MTFRRRSQDTPSVNVNARLARMTSDDLETVSEQSLMNAGRALDNFRHSGSAVDLDIAMRLAEQAQQALATMMARLFPTAPDS